MGVNSFLKNLFGSAKETTNKLADKAEQTLEHTKENTSPYIEKADAFANESIEKTKEAATPILEKVNDYTHQTKEVVGEYSDEATKALLNIVKTVKESTAEALKNTEAVIEETKESRIDMTENKQALNNDSASKEFRNRIEEDAD
jgi:ElaB/YqjD/DUF883 family membrane-anchored ribosome-binding protein